MKIKFTHLNKELFPKIKKKELINYYNKIADRIVEILKDRLVVLKRYPKGIEEEGFYQKNASDYFPEWLKTKEVNDKQDGKTNYVVVNKKDTLLYLANQDTITFHMWLSRLKNLNRPDRAVFDLDPPKNKDFELVYKGAIAIKRLMDNLKLKVFLMASGSKGLHIVIPLDEKADFDKVRKFMQDSAKYLAKKYNKDFTVEQRKEKRKGRLLLDTARNAFGQTQVCPYSVRARNKAPVAVPLEWNEISAKFDPQKYTIKNIFKRLKQKRDPWKNFMKSKQSLDNAIKKLSEKRNKKQK